MTPLMPVADAYAAVLKYAAPLPEESVALAEAFHRTLARDVASLRTQPPAAMSAMDGYAVRAADAVLGARLKVVGEVAAGRPFNATIGAGEAARIFTGGVVPAGADAVVIQEDATREGDVVVVNEAPVAGKNIRTAGIDFREGDVLLRRGARLTDRDLGLAAAMNHARLPVHRRPRVAILGGGDELVPPGTTPGPGQIVHSNAFALAALARSAGADATDLGVARDTMDATIAAIRRARELGADVLVTTGGASVGDHDMVKCALEAEGTEMAFWRIALRPGKPMMHGRLGAMRVLGLPAIRCRPTSALPVPGAAAARAVGAQHDRPPHRPRGARPRACRQRPAPGLSAGADHRQRRRRARGRLGRPAGFLAGRQPRRRRRADRAAAVRPRRAHRQLLHHHPAACLTARRSFTRN